MLSQIPPNTIQQMDAISKALSSVPSPFSSMMEDLIKRALEATRDFWFDCLLAATVAVFIGVLLEEAEKWTPLVKRLFSLKGITQYRLTKKLEHFGWIVLCVGVMCEGMFEGLFANADHKLQNFDENLVTIARKQAGDAAKSAKTAHEAVHAVEAEAKELDKRLAVASAKMGVLEKRIASQGARWQLLEDNKAAFIKDMARFSGQKIFLISCGMTGGEWIEANQLELDLRNFLGKFDGAGWVVDDPKAVTWKATTWGDCSKATAGDPPVVDGGIVLVLSNTQYFSEEHSAMDAAKALKGELNNKIMITTRIAGDTKLDNASALAEAGSFWKFVEDNPKAVFLLVGPNPMFRLSNAEKRLNAKAGK